MTDVGTCSGAGVIMAAMDHLTAPGLVDLHDHDEDLLMHALGPTDGYRNEIPSGTPDPTQMADPPKIRVVVRTRPINQRELDKGDDDIVGVDMPSGTLMVNEPKQKVDLTKFTETHRFVFDDALDASVSNDLVYSYTVQPLVHTIFKQGKATCFAYGQTGSGKTYTMSPLPPRAAEEILALLTTPAYSDLSLYVSCFEIYGGKVYDLLNGRKKLEVREDARRKVNVVGLKEFHVEDQELVQQLIEHSAAARCTGNTAANAESSRSHSIMQFSLKKFKQNGDPNGREVGRLSFIDLAGSERGADTFDNDRQTRIEGAEINKSLLALKECIRALDGDARHVPFRGSKLTEVLRDSFIGEQARTVMIANVSPSSSSVEHTLNTLRYADRVKELRKDKAARSPGGVTPGPNAAKYNASVLRANPEPAIKERVSAVNAPAHPPVITNAAKQPFVPRPAATSEQQAAAQAQPLREMNYGLSGTAANDSVHGAAGAENNAMLMAREELMNAILEEEDELIQCHRKQIEDTMDITRSEMNLLAEVDQPGSAIDTYVDKLGRILRDKTASIQLLQAKLDSFKAKLREEEIMSKTMGQQRR